MKKAENLLKGTNPEADTITGYFGITDERKEEVIKTTQKIAKDEMNKGEAGNNAKVIEDVWNEFENPAECAFALFILQQVESEIAVHELFRLPENVGR